MLHQRNGLLAVLRFVHRRAFALAIVFVAVHTAQAKPLDKPACEALKTEHQTLLDQGIEDVIARGSEWAKTHLGQLKTQQMARVFEIEEQLAFRCKGMALTSAVVIHSLRDVKSPKPKVVPAATTQRGVLKRVRRSAVPMPVKRPALSPAQVLRAKPSGQIRVGTSKSVPPVPSATAPSAPQKKAGPSVKANAIQGPPGSDQAKLPKVIRLQPKTASGKKSGNVKTSRAKARQAKARQIKARKIRRGLDTYVPPPENPGYQPSLKTR